jgi:soluble lytic murein transglycosylase
MGRTFTNREKRSQANLPDLEVYHRGTHRRALVWLLGSALAVVGAADALSAGRHKDSSSARHKDSSPAASHEDSSSGESPKGRSGHKSASSRHKKESKAAAVERHKHVITQPAEDAAPLPPELVALKQATELVQQGKAKDATVLAASIGDPAAAKIVEWAQLRHADSGAGFDRYAAFIRANPDWPVMRIRRRAEARLWQERRDGPSVRRFLGNEPASALGRLARC